MVSISKMIVPALIAGLITGVLSVVPILSCCNICCLWILVGGVLAAYLLQRSGKITLEEGAIVGILSGIVYAFTATVLGAIMSLLVLKFMSSFMQSMMGAYGVPEQAYRPMMFGGMGSLSRFSFIVQTLIWGVINTVLGVIFGAVGGVLGAKLTEK